MKTTAYAILGIALSALCLTADFSINMGGWEFERENTELGFDLSGGGGISIPLNLNDKPAAYDISETYDPIAPTITVRAGLGAYRFDKIPNLNGTLAAEYNRTTYESDSTDLVFNSFGIYNGFSAHPVDHVSIRQATSTGLFIISSEPDRTVTGTFADYTADEEARTEKPHLYSATELGIGFTVGKTPFLELSADARVETYYPRYVFWPELARGLTYSAIEGGTSALADRTDVWALKLIGPALTTAMELFNLNFYPDKVGETHQHVFTPTLTLTFHF